MRVQSTQPTNVLAIISRSVHNRIRTKYLTFNSLYRREKTDTRDGKRYAHVEELAKEWPKTKERWRKQLWIAIP